MPYVAQISRATPSVFFFLVDQSGSMADLMAGSTDTKATYVATAVNRWLQNMVMRCSKDGGIRNYFEVGVIGYGQNVGPVLGGGLEGKTIVPISEIADAPLRVDTRTKKEPDGVGGLVETSFDLKIWLDPVALNNTPMCQALDMAYVILTDWTKSHPTSYPPTVVHITDGEATDGEPVPFAQRIMELHTDDGNVIMMNCHISSLNTPIQPIFPDSELLLPDRYAKDLFNMSSVLPPAPREAARGERFTISENSRAYAFNADATRFLQWLDIGTRTTGPVGR